MEIIRLVLGLALPWILGVALMIAVRPPERSSGLPGEGAWIIGAGYLAGAFLLTLWMRALSLAGIPFGVAAIALPLVVMTAVLAAFAWRAAPASGLAVGGALRALTTPPVMQRIARIAWWAIIGWLALRFILLGIELGLRPLYPWDAWIQWATKARVWYELRTIAPFARAEAWFAADGALYFDASPEYPPTMPLLQAWTALALGRWDDALMNWPWWQIAVGLTLAIYGGLRSLGVAALPALAGAFFVASLPLANAHVALAGYADLPMAAYYSVAALAVLRWTRYRRWHDATTAAFFAVACSQIKNPGIIWTLTLLPGIAVAWWPRRGLRVAGVSFAAAALLLAFLAQTHPVLLNYRLHLDFDPQWAALGRSYFLLGNWHLLWYGAIAAAVLAYRQLLSPPLAPVTMIAAAGALFLFFVFGFTNARQWVADQTTVNRASLHFAPLAVIFMMLAFDAFSRRWQAAADPAPAVHPAPAAATGAPIGA
ncbi:MAG: hypothetical protein ABJC33_02145 [Betaproteobacteria bacterium]